MADEIEIPYKEGDVVWVKLGTCWWPGLIQDIDKLPEEILENFKKRPLAAVRFFEEDKYEYIRNLNNICYYTSRRKIEFIQRGLDQLRSKMKEGSSYMTKFPIDISKAERLTGGDPDILSREEFAPRERLNYKEIFGDSSGKKKKNKDSGGKVKSNSKEGKRPVRSNGHTLLIKTQGLVETPKPIRPPITHRRFLYGSDHEVRIRTQPVLQPKESETPATPYKCHVCGFTATRLNVIVLHTKSHSESFLAARNENKVNTSTKVKRSRVCMSTGEKKAKKPTPKVLRPKVKRKLLPKYEETKKQPSESPKVDKPPAQTRKKGKVLTKKKKVTETRDTLLADWDEEDAEEEEKEREKLKQELEKTKSDAEAGEDEYSELQFDEEDSEANAGDGSGENNEDFDTAVESILAETTVPQLPEVPKLPSSNETDLEMVNLGNNSSSQHKDNSEESKTETFVNVSSAMAFEKQLVSSLSMPLEVNEASSADKRNAPSASSSAKEETAIKSSSLLGNIEKGTSGTVDIKTTSACIVTSTNTSITSTNSSGNDSTNVDNGAATYVLYIDDSGSLRSLNTLGGDGNTLLIPPYGSSQGECSERTVYIDPSTLPVNASDVDNIYLTINEEGTPQMVQLVQPGAKTQVDTPMVYVTSEGSTKSKTSQDILAEALANTQVLQTETSSNQVSVINQSSVTVTNSRAAQYPVMTPRVVSSCPSDASSKQLSNARTSGNFTESVPAASVANEPSGVVVESRQSEHRLPSTPASSLATLANICAESSKDNSGFSRNVYDLDSQCNPTVITSVISEPSVAVKRQIDEALRELSYAKKLKLEDNERKLSSLKSCHEENKSAPSMKTSPPEILEEEDVSSDSDDEELPPVHLDYHEEESKRYQVNDIVWAKYEGIHWPAVITRVDAKSKKTYVKFVNSPRREKGIRKCPQSLCPFTNLDRNMELLERGKKLKGGEAIQRAYDKVLAFYTISCSQDISATRFLTRDPDDLLYGFGVGEKCKGDDDDANSTSCSSSPCQMVSEDHKTESDSDGQEKVEENCVEEIKAPEKDEVVTKLVNIIKSEECKTYLRHVFEGSKNSSRHASFKPGDSTQKQKMLVLSGFAPIPYEVGENQATEITSFLRDYLSEMTSKPVVGHLFDYICCVWIPEAMIFALQKLHNTTREDAEKEYLNYQRKENMEFRKSQNKA